MCFAREFGQGTSSRVVAAAVRCCWAMNIYIYPALFFIEKAQTRMPHSVGARPVSHAVSMSPQASSCRSTRSTTATPTAHREYAPTLSMQPSQRQLPATAVEPQQRERESIRNNKTAGSESLKTMAGVQSQAQSKKAAGSLPSSPTSTARTPRRTARTSSSGRG